MAMLRYLLVMARPLVSLAEEKLGPVLVKVFPRSAMAKWIKRRASMRASARAGRSTSR